MAHFFLKKVLFSRIKKMLRLRKHRIFAKQIIPGLSGILDELSLSILEDLLYSSSPHSGLA